MKITSARTTVVGTPWRELVFLELETDTGLVGTSEVRMVSRTDTLVACLDELAPRVRRQLAAPDLPLACILEGGTWAAGRQLAQELRGGDPPLPIKSDGTVF